MQRKPKPAAEAPTALPSIPKELIDQFVKGPMTAEAVQAASAAFKKALIERALGAELGHHLGYAPGAERPQDATNQRNGKSGKTVLTEDGPLRLDIPRDRDGSFAPILIPKHARRFTGFDDKIIAMYARGMTVREIQGFLAEQYSTEVSPEFISSVSYPCVKRRSCRNPNNRGRVWPVQCADCRQATRHESADEAGRRTEKYSAPALYK